jgi:hypothetical protein
MCQCPAGRFGNVKNASSVNEGCPGQCPRGKYGPEAGHQFEYSACKLCDAGKYPKEGANIGATSAGEACEECQAGTYKMYMGVAPCTLCPLGRYGNDGKYNNGTGALTGGTELDKTCSNKCPKGRHGKSLGQIVLEKGCKKCEPGRYDNKESQQFCTEKCPKGTHGAEEGGASETTACKSCPPGSYNGKEGQANCTKCPIGRYGSGSGKTSISDACKNCKQGFYNDEVGLAACKGCGNMTTPVISDRTKKSEYVDLYEYNNLAHSILENSNRF